MRVGSVGMSSVWRINWPERNLWIATLLGTAAIHISSHFVVAEENEGRYCIRV